MDRKITKIEQQKRDSSRFNIYVNDEYAMSVHEDVLVRCHLAKGQVLQDENWKDILVQEEQSKAKQTALKSISYKPRTKAEIEHDLQAKGFSTEAISATLTWLESYGYVNDRAFAEAWIEERRRLHGKGRFALRQELQQKGVAEQWIAKALDTIDNEAERALASEWAHKRYERVKHLEWNQIERRIGSFLQRKGFSYSHITDVLGELRFKHEQKSQK